MRPYQRFPKALLTCVLMALPLPVLAQARVDTPAPPALTTLPSPVADPMRITLENDPVIALGRTVGSAEVFRDAIARAVARNPALAESVAAADEALAQRRQARAGLFPNADLSVTSFRTLDREFSNDPDNILERSRPFSRTDAQLAINQTIVDFGATSDRIASASANLRAAAAAQDDTAAQLALRTIGAWYDIFGYRTLLTISQDYRQMQEQRRGDLNQRITQGVSAESDIAQLQNRLSAIDARIARYQRQLASAEAVYTQLTGLPAPETMYRAPTMGQPPMKLEDARDDASRVPAVQVAEERAVAARRRAEASRASVLPNISAGIDAGRYGILEGRKDYDIRARVTLRMRLFGGVYAQVDQEFARSAGATATAARVREESARDAAIAFTDLRALNAQTTALEQSYLSARQSRDTIEARFKVARGSIFDVIGANDVYFGAATSYIESVIDRDTSYYILLARTGRLLSALEIKSAQTRKPL